MRIPKLSALGVSGLVLAGSAIIGMGAATPAGASGCCGGGNHRSVGAAHVKNHNFNFSRSHSLEAQRLHQRQHHFNNRHDFFRHHEEAEKKMMKPGGGHNGGGHDGDGHNGDGHDEPQW